MFDDNADHLIPDFTGQPFNATSGVPLDFCADGSLCCGVNWTIPATKDGSYNCCAQKRGHFFVDGKISTATPSSGFLATSTPSASSQSNPTKSASATPTPSSAPSSSSSDTGAIVGGVVGGVAAIAVLSLAFWFFVLRRKYNNVPQQQTGHQGHQQMVFDSNQQPMWHDTNGAVPHDPHKQTIWQGASEAPNNVYRGGELDAEGGLTQGYELPAKGR